MIWSVLRAVPVLLESAILEVVRSQLAKRKRSKAGFSSHQLSQDLVLHANTKVATNIRRNTATTEQGFIQPHEPSTELRPSPEAPGEQTPLQPANVADSSIPTRTLKNSRSRSARTGISSTIRLVGAASLAVQAVDFGLTLLGTGILGSAILMDVGQAIVFLLYLPILYSMMNFCLLTLHS